jgi:hypothetical protein
LGNRFPLAGGEALRSENLVLFERARRVRFRAALCREIIALCRNEKAVAELETLARDFEAQASELERKARRAASSRSSSRPSAFEPEHAQRPAPPEPLPPSEDDGGDTPR